MAHPLWLFLAAFTEKQGLCNLPASAGALATAHHRTPTAWMGQLLQDKFNNAAGEGKLMEFQHKHPTELDHELCHSQGDEFLPIFLLSPEPEHPPWAAWQGERGDGNMKCN